MKKSLNQLIWESKKSGKPVNPWAICTSSVGREDKAKYERCVMDVKKKSPIKEHHGEDWNPKLLDMSLNTFLDKLKSVDRRGYDSVESIIEKHKNNIVKESRINEVGGYDDPGMYAKHAGGYMSDLKEGYNSMATILNHFDKLRSEVLDDTMRRDIEKFLMDVQNPLKDLATSITNTEKKHLHNLRGGKPKPRDLDAE
jgi:hypothetical protein